MTPTHFLAAVGIVCHLSSFVAEPPRDLHAHLLEANRAQLVMLAERELMPRGQATRIARALQTIARQDAKPDAKRNAAYLDLEARLVKLVGADATDIHLGRSRNDLGATMNRMLMRDLLLDQCDHMSVVREKLHALAAAHRETIMPGFTHAVQAQPTTVAHFVLALDASLGRDAQRLREAYARLNRSPLGSGAFTTSSVPLDRDRLAELLGFEGLVENAYDAIMIAEGDCKVEFASALGLAALNVGRFAQYLLFQYDDPSPGFVLHGAIVSRSSAMPQKRNPSAIERLRLAASEVTANAQTATFFAHNTPLYEVKDLREDHLIRLIRWAAESASMWQQLARVLDSLTIQKDVLREEVDRDYSTMTELAETLHREARVPFRIGHQVASELTTVGREKGKRPRDLTHAEVDAVYRHVTKQALPLTDEQLRRAFDPLEIIRSRQGKGGPQPKETERMLKAQQQEAAEGRAWLATQRQHLQAASAALHERFGELAGRAE